MRTNRGSAKRNMAKHELALCLPVLVGWRPKPDRYRGPVVSAKPVKKPRWSMPIAGVDPTWSAIVIDKPALGHRGAARKSKTKQVKLTNQQKFEIGIKPNHRWLKRHGLEWNNSLN